MAETEFPVGVLIENRYRVLSVIGSGGMGTLYRVSDEAHLHGAGEDEVVALKTVRLRGPATDSPERVEHFQREFQLLTQLRHPNLVSVYDFGITTEGDLYFTMEWVEGEDLEPSRRPLEPGETVPVMVQVCRALAYLHARGVIHGDLKPHNVLITGDQIKLVDFGLAHEIRSTEDRVRYYTPGYTAPEMRKPEPVDHRVDLYSLGAMWYALLVGKAPMFVPGAGKERLIRFALDEMLERQGQVPLALGGVVARLMATSPNERYLSANEVIEAVNEITGSAYTLETRETASSYALRTHFVNREKEFERLQMLWKQAQSGAGKLALIGGESGVGKTRLVAELEVQAELEGARVVWGQCVESGGSAYHPWREVLRVLVRYVEGADEAAMQQVGPVLTTLLPELWDRDYMQLLEPPAGLDPQAAQRRLNRAIVQVFQAAARLRPTVIVIENAHWADEATLELVRFLARVPGQVGLLTCVTYRDDEVKADHPLETLVGEKMQRIRVRRLSPEVTTDLVRSMLGLERLPVLLTERVQQTTGGNAFFVQELIRSLATEGEVLHRTVRGWQVDGKALQKAQLPESIRQVVGRRMDQLSVDGRQALNRAAIVGMVFWEGAVAEVMRAPWQRMRMALREGLDQELVVIRDETAFAGEREYLFLNPTVWEVCYESIPEEEQREYHARAATWLMSHSDGEAGEHLGLIADHLERAGQTEQAVIYLTRAGEQAVDQFANAEAIDYLGRALNLTPEDDWSGRYALVLAREKVYDLQGAREAQIQDLTVLEELAQALADNRRRARVALRQANYAEAISDYRASSAAAQATIELARTVHDRQSEAEGHLQGARILLRQGEYEATQSKLEQALTLARAAGTYKIEADSLLILGTNCRYQGNYADGIAHYERALPIYREMNDRQGEGWLLCNLGDFFKYLGDYSRAQIDLEQALHVFREIGDRKGEGWASSNLGDTFRHQGDYDGARACFEQALHVSREIGDRLLEDTAVNNLGLVFHYLSDDESAWKYAQQALLITQEIGNPRAQAFALICKGHVLVGLGRLAEAAHAYQQTLDIRRGLGEHNLAIESLAGLARVSLARGDSTLALVHVEEILDHLESNTLDGTEEPFQVWLTCYSVLRANQDSRAQTVLSTAHRLLREQAARITSEEMHRSFLENVAAHREIAREFKKNE